MKVRRDNKGHVILGGSITFGNLIQPKISKRSRAHDLKSNASDRLLLLLKGRCKDKFSNDFYSIRQKKLLQSHNELASQSPIVQFAYYRSKLRSLVKELAELNSCGNNKKIMFKSKIMEMEIKETKDIIEELVTVITGAQHG